jgi:hypothetical protein
MAAGDKPTHSAATKPEGADKFEKLASGWENAKGQITFVADKDIPKGSRFTVFKNTPKPQNG